MREKAMFPSLFFRPTVRLQQIQTKKKLNQLQEKMYCLWNAPAPDIKKKLN
jgi:hypothetical protein